VLRPKVDGLRNLRALLPALDFLGATGSMAAWLGNAGQIAYAAANAWLDACCRSLRAHGTPACAIAFGPFAEAGMAARMTARERARLRERGIGTIPLASGTALGLACLQQQDPGPGVLPVRWNQFARQRGGAVPSLLRGLVAAPAAAAPVAAGELGSALAALPVDERRTRLRAHLRGLLAQVLGFAAPEQVDDGRTFGELGIDSLLAVELRTRLATALGLSLPATLLFDQPDLDRLARHLTDALGAPATPIPAPDGDGLAAALAAQVRAMEARP
jgi:acyl carrier protein